MIPRNLTSYRVNSSKAWSSQIVMMKLSELETFERFVDAARPNFSGKYPKLAEKFSRTWVFIIVGA